MSSERKLCFMTWNSNGLQVNREEKKRKIGKCDVVFLQETHSSESEILEVLDDYKSFYTTQTSNTTGVAILIKTNILEEECSIDKDIHGCYILVKCILNGQLFTLMSVYNHHINIRPLMKLTSVLEKHAEGILLIGGDFNVALNPYLDRTSRTKNPDHLHFRPVVEKLMTSFHLVDVWRRLHPTDRQYSYKQNSDNDIRSSRLDYIFVTEESMQYIEKCVISPCTFSDHRPVVLKICMSDKESKKREVCVDITELETRMQILKLQEKVVDKWLSCKRKYWPNLDLTLNPHITPLISDSEVLQAIQSLIVTEVERPDSLPVAFYKTYSYVLIPRLCAYFNKILQEPTNIPKAFTMRYKVSMTHYIFNVDYLILATIMARWLYEHLQSHSADYAIGITKKTVLFSLKVPINVLWSSLNGLLDEEQDKQRTEPPLHNKFKICVLHKILKDCLNTEYKSLYFGCPLTPVLITLYLKHVANKMIKKAKNQRTSIHISRENVIVTFSEEFDLLENFKEKLNSVEFTILEPDSSK
nr:uncharacterized protein LOC129456101 [Misgurnus anguillicaudatus]